jgi:hypothetical protein
LAIGSGLFSGKQTPNVVGECCKQCCMKGIVAEMEGAIMKKSRLLRGLRREAPPGFEPGMEVLQTSALPLGYGAAEEEGRALPFPAGAKRNYPNLKVGEGQVDLGGL